jgi:hypothetical protein
MQSGQKTVIDSSVSRSVYHGAAMSLLADYTPVEEDGIKTCRLRSEHTYNADGPAFSKTFDASGPVLQVSGSSYYSADITGSIKLITDNSGGLAASYSYSAFGA